MDRPPPLAPKIFKAVIALVAIGIAAIWISMAFLVMVDFFQNDGGEGLGNPGHVLVALLYLVLAGPFLGIALALGLPLISNNPKFRG